MLIGHGKTVTRVSIDRGVDPEWIEESHTFFPLYTTVVASFFLEDGLIDQDWVLLNAFYPLNQGCRRKSTSFGSPQGGAIMKKIQLGGEVGWFDRYAMQINR